MTNDSPGPAKGGVSRLIDSLTTPFRLSRVEGFVDSVRAQEISGWAFDVARPQRRVHIVARANRKIVAETLADLPRRDLASLGKGDGRYGFRLRIPAEVADEVTVEAVAKPRNVPLKRGKVTLLPASTAKEEKPAPGPKAGFVERFVGREVSGWAVDPRRPEGQATVDIFDDEIFLGVAACDQERPNLIKSGTPEGARGFRFILPQGAATTADALRVRVSGTRLELARSRNYPGSAVDPALEVATGHDIGAGLEAIARPSEGPRPRHPPLRMKAPLSFVIIGDDLEAAVLSEASCLAAGLTSGRRIASLADLAEAPAASRVLLLTAGDEISADLAVLLRESSGAAEAWTWRTSSTGDEVFGSAQTRALVGSLDGALALDGGVLSIVARALDDRQRLSVSAVGRAAAEMGIVWQGFDAVLSKGDGSEALTDDLPRPARLSIALWSGWTADAPPPGLDALIGSAEGQVELLAPANAAKPLSLFEGRRPVTSLRLVDLPEGAPEYEAWVRFTRAATGEVIFLARGDLVFDDPRQLSRLCAWAALPQVGCVTAALRGGNGEILAGMDATQLDGGWNMRSARGLSNSTRPQMVAGASADLLCVSRAAVAQVGGLRMEDEEVADLALGLRLMEEGRSSMLAPGVTVSVTSSISTDRRLPSRAQARLSGSLRKVARAFA